MDFFTALKQNINEYIVANGNKEITADILRPILLEICNITFAKMGDLELLQTVYKTDLVGAINEALNAESGVKIHYGTSPNPNVVLINFELGDFYAQQGPTGIDSFWQYNGRKWVKIADSGTGIYQGASPTTRTVGGLNSGTNISGKTYDELFEAMLAEYVAPSISSFSMEGQNSPIEVGTVISGNKNFSFNFSQSGNVANNTIKIIDVTDNNNVLASGLSKTSPQSVNVGSVSKTTATDNVWRIEAESTKGATIARNMSIQWQYRYFFGGSATDVTTSTQVRALATSGLDSGGTNNVEVTAGTGNTEFYFFVQNSRKIDAVIDTSALNAPITSAYVLVGTITVNDNGSNPQTYKKYKLTLADAYVTPHVHRITIKNN